MFRCAVVVVDPVRDLFPCVIEPEKQALVEKLVAHAAVEALAKAVLHRLSRRNEMPDDLVVPREGEHGVRGELGPVVRDDHAGLAAPLDQRRQFARHAPPGDRGVGDRRQAFPRHVVDDVQNAEPPAAGELIVDEIHGPAGVGDRLDQYRRPRPHGAAPSAALTHREAFLPIQPIDAVDPRRFALLAQQDEQPPIAKALALIGESLEPRPQFRVRRSA